jgi:hypothetical protein
MQNPTTTHPFPRCLALLWVVLAFCGAIAPAADTVRPPTIYAFNTYGPLTVNLGETVGFNWSVGGATEISISPDIGVVTDTWVEIVPMKTTTYTLTARNAAGSVTKARTITVIVPPVVASFTATPEALIAGSTARLNWSAPGATSYHITADVGSDPGQFFTTTTTVRPTATTTYTLTARNSAGTGTKTLTVPVTPPPPKPTINSFTATPTTVVVGRATTLAWAVNGATSLKITPGIGAVTGTSATVTPTANTTYTLTATNAGGSVTKKVTVTVTPLPTPPTIAAFTATPATIIAGSPTTLTWSAAGAEVLEITANTGANPGLVTGTSLSVAPTVSTTYTLKATNAGGSVTRTAEIVVRPPAPVIGAFAAAPATVVLGGSTTLSWSVTGATQVAITPGIGAVTGTSVVVTPTAGTTYTLTATNETGSVTRTVAVDVLVPLPVIAAFAATPAAVLVGSPVTLTWEATGAEVVTIAPGIGAVMGTSLMVTPTANTTYVLTATNAGGSVTRMANVTVTTPEPLPVIGAFAATPASIAPGATTTLSWSVSGAAAVVISANTGTSPGAVSGSSVTVSPAANTTYTLTATNGSGGSVTQTVSVAVTAPPVPVNLFADPRFEAGVSGVFAQDASSAVTQSPVAPLEGAHSLRVAINGYGNNVWWTHDFNGGLASHFLVRARARSDVASASTLMFSAMIYFADGTTTITQVPVSGAAGDKGIISVQTPIDPTKRLQSVRLRLIQEGGAPVIFTFDEAEACLDVVEAPPARGGNGGGGGGDGGGGDTGGGGGSIGCPPVEPDDSVYPGFTYYLPAARPFISLASYTQGAQASAAYARFRAAADQAVTGNPPYAYSAVSSVAMYRITGNPVYIDDAIARVEAFVAAAEQAIAGGGRPAIAGDSYLEIGWYIEQLALAYDSGFDRLTPAQRQRWAAFADQALFNLWHPSEATWGGVAYPWTGWSICDPGNNYHFHFLRATMLWALATKSAPLLEFLQSAKFPRLVTYYRELPGGGSREGTGYGTAQKDLFENYLIWKDSTGEDLSELTAHTRQTIDYWVHATVPTRDRFAPIGDQSRSSVPDLFDYHENLVHTAVVLNPGTAEARRGTWWLNQNSVNGVSAAFNLMGDLLPLPDAPTVPTERVYHAAGAGVLFARSNWNTDAAWISFMAGKYDQSHAHQDQGAFTFFKRDWLAVTANIWSNSGINQETVYHNTIRFERADGSVIAQNPSDTVQSTMTSTITAGGQVNASAELGNAFSRNATLVQRWTRNLEFAGDTLRIYDTSTVAPGVRAVFQLHVPVLPVLQTDGSLQAGNLRIVRLQGASYTVNALPAEFSRGYRIDFTADAGNSFAIELTGL